MARDRNAVLGMVDYVRSPTLMWSGSLFYFVYFLAAGAYMPFIYVYFVQLGMSGTQVGVLSSFAPAMSMVVAPYIASLADRRGRRIPVAQACLVFTGVILASLILAKTFVVAACLMF
ncbi:MAG: MFS transporter, partial [Anaerolineae bacterium]